MTDAASRREESGKGRPRVYGMGFLALDIVRSAHFKSSSRSYAGGTCGNVLAILAYLGWDAHAIASLNGDPASKRVREDLSLAGVKLGLSRIAPTAHTPIVVQLIRRDVKQHGFERKCPECGHSLPRFNAVPVQAVARVAAAMAQPSVFFMDRVSRSSIELAKVAAARGALVYFEPSEIGDSSLFDDAIRLSHIVKYARERLPLGGNAMDAPNLLLQIQTLGSEGLVFRSPLVGEGGWRHLDPIRAPSVIDACGAGDWCTAGIVASLGPSGAEGLVVFDEAKLTHALRYGQALAAWNCGFEGARGGMYRVKRSSFAKQVAAILGETTSVNTGYPNSRSRPRAFSSGRFVCPACPPEKATSTTRIGR